MQCFGVAPGVCHFSFAEALVRGSALLVHSRLTFGVEVFAALFSGFLVLSFAAGAVVPSLVIL